MRYMFLILAAMVCQTTVLAQTTDSAQPASRPAPEQIEAELDKNHAKPAPIMPMTPGDPASDYNHNNELAPGTVPGQLLLWPEDFRLAMQKGKLREKEGLWYFEFEDANDTPPIRLLCNSKLEQMQTYSQLGKKQITFNITGDVTEYKNENYLLVRDVILSSRLASQPTGQAATKNSSEKQNTTPENNTSPSSATDVLEAMDEEAEPAELLSEEATDSAQGPLDESSDTREASRLLPEDARLVDRLGRIVRESDAWTFVFESESDQPADPPIKLLPNLALQDLEKTTGGGVRRLIIKVTGDVTEYQGQNYLLIRRYTLQRQDGNLQ